jgi:phosphohistidine phosphatase
MLRLLLLRHAEAQAYAGDGDLERPLTPTGRADAQRIGAYFCKSGLVPDLVLVSPARRARETFEIVERELASTPAAAIEPSLHTAGMDVLEALVAAAPTGIKALLIVGHNPGLAEFANALAGEGDSADRARMRAQFPAPCLAVVDFHGDDWRAARVGCGRLDRFVTLAALSG